MGEDGDRSMLLNISNYDIAIGFLYAGNATITNVTAKNIDEYF